MSKKNKKIKKVEETFNPEVDTGIDSPVRVRVAARDINDKYSEYPSEGLTPRKLARIFKAADDGDVRSQMEMYEEIEEKDLHIASQMGTRKMSVTGLDWEIQPASDEETDKRVAKFISDQLEGLENFSDIMMDMLDAIGKGISISEITWGVSSEGYNIIEDIEWVHPKKLIWDFQSDEMKICTREYPSGISFPENKFVIHKYKARSGHTSRAGLLRVIAWMYMFKNYDVKDWISFCEVFGIPLRLGKYNSAASEDDKKALLEAIYSLGSDAAGIIPDTATIEFIESNKTSTVEIYEKFARYADEQISKVIVGQTLTADSGGGSYAQSKTHNDVRHDLTVADAKSLASTIKRDIIRPLVLFNFGEDVPIPTIQFDCGDEDNLKETVTIYDTLFKMGLKIPERHLYKKFAIPKPEDGEAVLDFAKMQPAASTQPDNVIEQKKLKDDSVKATPEQDELDTIVEVSKKKSGEIFGEIIKPILNLIDKNDSLEDVQEVLKDTDTLKQLYQDMNSSELDDLIHQGIYISKLIGRSQS